MSTAQMYRLPLALFLALLIGCAGNQRVPDLPKKETPSEALKKPWDTAMETCHVDPIAITVVCPAEDFRTVMKSCVSIWEQKGLCESRLTEAIKLGLVDKAELEARAYDLQAKLDSPWRSPWLWGAIGLSVGLVVGVGTSLGTK